MLRRVERGNYAQNFYPPSDLSLYEKEIPSNIANSFNAMIPTLLSVTLATIAYGIFDKFSTTAMETIYQLVQLPLQGISNNIFAVIACVLIGTIFWWFGVHGGTICIALFDALQLSNLQANAALAAAGLPITAENGAYIFYVSFNFVRKKLSLLL